MRHPREVLRRYFSKPSFYIRTQEQIFHLYENELRSSNTNGNNIRFLLTKNKFSTIVGYRKYLRNENEIKSLSCSD